MANNKVLAGDYEGCLITGIIIHLSLKDIKRIKEELKEQGLAYSFEDGMVPLTRDYVESYKEVPSKETKFQMAEVTFRNGKKSLIQLDAKAWTEFVKANFNTPEDYQPQLPKHKPYKAPGKARKVLKWAGICVAVVVVGNVFLTSTNDSSTEASVSSSVPPQKMTTENGVGKSESNLKSEVPAVDPASKIAKGAVSPMKKKGYEKTYAKWGESQIKRINELMPKAALAVARSERCDRVEWVSLSDARSTAKKEAVFLVQCKNNERFYVSEKDIDKTAVSVQEATSKYNNEWYSKQCFNLFQNSFYEKFAGTDMTASYNMGGTVYRAPSTGNVVVTHNWTVKGNNNSAKIRVKCTFDDRGLIDVDIK